MPFENIDIRFIAEVYQLLSKENLDSFL